MLTDNHGGGGDLLQEVPPDAGHLVGESLRADALDDEGGEGRDLPDGGEDGDAHETPGPEGPEAYGLVALDEDLRADPHDDVQARLPEGVFYRLCMLFS